jgi:alpha-N-arabinofuranosidase
LLSEETTVQPGAWRLWHGEFTAPCSAKGARLEVALATPGTVWLGAVSIVPADHFHGMRRDVVDRLKQLRPGNLRWPGGCFAEYYRWQDGLLPVDRRPPTGPHRWYGLLPDSDGYDNHDIGIDEFMALCREIGAAPAITTRFSEGSPEEAAAWVEYCNGASTTRWGKVRAERGHAEPYDVNCWYVGNELTGMSLLKGEARTNPKLLATLCREHIEAMKAVDPTITVNVGIPASSGWLVPLFEAAGSMVDEVQTGFYFPPDAPISVADAIHAPVHTILPRVRQLRQSVDSLAPSARRVGIAYYEWNVMWDRSGDARSGLFAAGMLNMLCREASRLGIVRASYFQPVTEGAIRVEPRSCEYEPDGQVFALYAAHQGNRLLDVPADTEGVVDVCASVAPNGTSVFATVVNRHPASNCALTLTVDGFTAVTGASADLLVPTTLDGEGGFTQRQVTLDIVDGNRLELSLPRLSIAGIRVHMAGSHR